MSVQNFEDFSAVRLDEVAQETNLWGVLSPDQCTAVVVEAFRGHDRRTGQNLSARPYGLFIGDEGSLSFEPGTYVPKGENVMRASVNAAEVRMNPVSLGSLSEGPTRVEYAEEFIVGDKTTKEGGAVSRVVAKPIDELGVESVDPDVDLDRLEARVVKAIGAQFIAMTETMKATGEKFGIPAMIPKYEPIDEYA